MAVVRRRVPAAVAAAVPAAEARELVVAGLVAREVAERLEAVDLREQEAAAEVARRANR